MSFASRNLSPGGYVPGSSFLHKLDPRVKLIALLAAAIFTLTTRDARALAVYAVCLALLFAVSGIPAGLVIRELKGLVWFFVLAVCLQAALVWGPGGDPGMLANSPYLLFVTRIMLLSLATLVIMHTTEPSSITQGFRQWSPKNAFFNRICLVMNIILQFTPFLFKEAGRIRTVGMVRRVSGPGGILKRVRTVAGVAVPLLCFALVRADRLTDALTARGYVLDGTERTRYDILRFGWRDWLVLVLLAGAITFMALR